MHEEMITPSDSYNTVDLGPYFAILPTSGEFTMDDYCTSTGATRVAPGFSYTSGNNDEFLSVGQLRDMISQEVTPLAQH
jgi:hypothetical protein